MLHQFLDTGTSDLRDLNGDVAQFTALVSVPDTNMVKVIYGLGTAAIGQVSPLANRLLALFGEGGMALGPAQTIVLDATMRDKTQAKSLGNRCQQVSAVAVTPPATVPKDDGTFKVSEGGKARMCAMCGLLLDDAGDDCFLKWYTSQTISKHGAGLFKVFITLKFWMSSKVFFLLK